MGIEFTKEEAALIDKKLGPIIFDWAKILINHIVTQARSNSVDVVYMNTPQTLKAGAITGDKTAYFYEKLPPLIGFKKESANLRNNGNEILWAYHLNQTTASLRNILVKLAKNYRLEDIPSKYQGAFLSILKGKKEFYTDEDVRRVLSILELKEKKAKLKSRFYYDWSSRTYEGKQNFYKGRAENIVLQKITGEMQKVIISDDTLRKFWAYIVSFRGHFGPDVIGFALVSRVSNKIWVINEIQSDCINHYLDLRSKALGWTKINERNEEKKSDGVTFEVLKDMLITNNRSKWIAKMEINEPFRNQVMSNPNIIQELPDDSHDINKWISEQQVGRGLDLIQHFQSVNFNSRVFRLS